MGWKGGRGTSSHLHAAGLWVASPGATNLRRRGRDSASKQKGGRHYSCLDNRDKWEGEQQDRLYLMGTLVNLHSSISVHTGATDNTMAVDSSPRA